MAKKDTPSLVDKFVIRLPSGLRKQIKALSEQNRRSMNSEIIMVLEKHIQQFTMSEQDSLDDLSASIANDQVLFTEESHTETETPEEKLSKKLSDLSPEKRKALLELLDI